MKATGIRKIAEFSREDFSTEFIDFLESIAPDWEDTRLSGEDIYHIGDVTDAVDTTGPSKHIRETYKELHRCIKLLGCKSFYLIG